MFSSHGGFISYVMHHQRGSIKSSQIKSTHIDETKKITHDKQIGRGQEDIKLNHGDPSQIQASVIPESEFSAKNLLNVYFMTHFLNSFYILASTRENLSSEVCEQQRRRQVCASAQSDQRICYSLFGKHQI